MNGRLCLLWTKQDFVDYYADAETCAPVSWYFHNMRTRFDTISWAPGAAAPEGKFAPPAYCLGRTSAVTLRLVRRADVPLLALGDGLERLEGR